MPGPAPPAQRTGFVSSIPSALAMDMSESIVRSFGSLSAPMRRPLAMDMMSCVSMPKGQNVMQRRQPVQDHAASDTSSRVASSSVSTSPSHGAIFPSILKYS